MAPMLTRFEAENWRCLKKVEVDLPKFGALIGPNDSGKSTVLRAIDALSCALGQHGPARALPDPGDLFRIELTTPLGAIDFGRVNAGDPPRFFDRRNASEPVVDAVGACVLVRFDPDALRATSHLVPENRAVDFLSERGQGLAGIYQAILARGDDAFSAIAKSVRQLFPTVSRVAVPAVSTTEVSLEVELVDGTRVRAPAMSEGLLLYLAFAAIPYIQRVQTLLVEEPETGLHPARIRQVIAMLRKFSDDSGTQVLMSTHSPLVVNELRPEEVIVLTRTAEEGTRATLLRDTPHFAERAKVYALGELWLAYADGDLERPLLEGNA